MNVLFITSELAGYVKTGGLGDVSAALPKALRARGIDVRILIPRYGDVQYTPKMEQLVSLPGSAAIPPCDLATGATQDGTPTYYVVAPELYERQGTPYADPERKDWPDNDVRFARLALAGAQIAMGGAGLDWAPDLIHANDWPAALVTGYLAWRGARIPVLYTVHNLAYQGLFAPDRGAPLGIPGHAFAMEGMEFYGQLSFMKAGLTYSAHVTTVSPTYAKEIATPEFGCGLDGLLATLGSQGRLSGIANGVADDWAPGADRHLVQAYPPRTSEAKKRNAEFVRDRFHLAKGGRRPLFAMVSRFVHQKGVDLALHASATIVAAGGQFVLLGEGERALEEAARAAAEQHPGSIGVSIAFDETLARRITAASDFYLMPSRFEPCGLNQMYAQRYGSLPIASATGGLVDTIEDGKTGFLFEGPRPETLDLALVRALRVFLEPDASRRMRRAAMAKDFSWDRSAQAYLEIYTRLAPAASMAAQ
jgi:starch synthase